MDAFVRRQPSKDDEVGNRSHHIELVSGRAQKRVKREEIKDSESEESEEASSENEREERPGHESDNDRKPYDRGAGRVTDIENALPPTQSEGDAIKEYEAFKSSQASAAEDGTTEKTRPMWIKGRSSIYVDAFNLALDTVLEEESHLFNEKEMEVFRQWRELDYEAQYL